MKRSSIVAHLALVAVIGCTAKTEPLSTVPSDETTTTASQGGATSTTFVSLKVPNMF